jgi:sRNA-binding protein
MTAPRRIITLPKAKPKPPEPPVASGSKNLEANPAPPISKTRLAKARLKATTEWLHETWPLAFRSPIRPLAIGAGIEIDAHPSTDFTADERRAAIRAWTGRSAYTTAIIQRRRRVNFDGSDATEVTDDERRHAFERLKALEKRKSPAATKPQGQALDDKDEKTDEDNQQGRLRRESRKPSGTSR